MNVLFKTNYFIISLFKTNYLVLSIINYFITYFLSKNKYDILTKNRSFREYLYKWTR